MTTQKLDQARISRNYSLAKVLSILAVVSGHFFDGSRLWLFATIGLSIFAFSSAYFTAQRYRPPIALGPYWRTKLLRLLPALLVINLFILALLLIRGDGKIWHWHTPIAMLGMSPLLEWNGIRLQTSFGDALWFFTVLILFYAVYPLLAWSLTGSRYANHLALVLLASIAIVAQTLYSPGYMLWLVVASFGFGIWAQAADWRPTPRFSSLALLISCVALASATFASLAPLLKHALLVAFCVSIQAGLLSLSLPQWLNVFKPLEPCVLEIYFIHGYVLSMMHLPMTLPGFLLGLGAIVLSALLLERLRSRVLWPRTQR